MGDFVAARPKLNGQINTKTRPHILHGIKKHIYQEWRPILVVHE